MKYIYRFVFLVLSLVLVLPLCMSQGYNQYAYTPTSVKRLFLEKDMATSVFKLIDSQGNTAYESKTSEAEEWPYSGTKVCIADFSSFNTVGKYKVVIEGYQSEIDVLIKEDSYKTLGNALAKSYYFARCSEPLLKEYAGIYAREAGHPDTKVMIHASAAGENRPEGSTFASPGGWYDAGDYGKYIVNSSITTFTLLHLYELFPEYLKALDLNIPESGNGTADLLDETLVNLRWMLSMQDPNDGGVYHKLTTKSFCGMVMPHKDKADRYVVLKTTAASLDFAATMAKASRILKDESPELRELSNQCLKAAEAAWAWCESHPDVLYVQPDDIKTGQYNDDNIDDEWFWAATELYLSSGNKQYKQKIDLSQQKFTRPEWRRVNTLGLYSLIHDEKFAKKIDKNGAEAVIIKIADRLYGNYQKSAYKVSLTVFPWGSNGEVMNDGLHLINAYLITDNKKYLEAADACVGYALGANPLCKSFVTGFGKNTPMFLHDRRCEADGIEAPIPGLLAGGPTNSVQSDCGKDKYGTSIPALSYIDDVCSYSTNEVAINWNAPATFVLLALDAIYSDKK